MSWFSLPKIFLKESYLLIFTHQNFKKNVVLEEGEIGWEAATCILKNYVICIIWEGIIIFMSYLCVHTQCIFMIFIISYSYSWRLWQNSKYFCITWRWYIKFCLWMQTCLPRWEEFPCGCLSAGCICLFT